MYGDGPRPISPPRRLRRRARLVGAESDHIVSIGGRAPWTLEYLELATHHGNSTGLLTAFVLPGGPRQFQPPRAVHLVLAWLALAVLLTLPSRAFLSRLARVVSATGVALALLLVALLLLLPWFLPYFVVIAPGTFATLVLLATCSRTWPLSSSRRRPTSPQLLRRRSRVRPPPL